MDIQIATLCKSATEFPNQELVIVGTIDTIAAPKMPVVIPQCSIAMRICITPDDSGKHQFGVNIIDADGISLDENMPIIADMPIDLPETIPFLTRNLILNLQGLKFPAVGIYSIDMTLDGELIQRVPLRVLKLGDDGKPEEA
jgi:hypothetical protein